MLSESQIEADLESGVFSDECFLMGVLLWNNFLKYKTRVSNTAASCESIAAIVETG